jgi:NAD(P)H-dependent FMN reductase
MEFSTVSKIAIIVGSTRPNRFGPQVANWLLKAGQQRGDAEFDLIDLEEVDLPIFNEPGYPSMGQLTVPHAVAWSEKISQYDGFILVTPEYNHSTSPALLNALTYLYQEWNFKPVAFASYGGGAGGSRAVEHLRGVAGELKMFDIREQLLIPSYYLRLNDQFQYQFSDAEIKATNELLDQIVFWSEQMAESRAALAERSATAVAAD